MPATSTVRPATEIASATSRATRASNRVGIRIAAATAIGTVAHAATWNSRGGQPTRTCSIDASTTTSVATASVSATASICVRSAPRRAWSAWITNAAVSHTTARTSQPSLVAAPPCQPTTAAAIDATTASVAIAKRAPPSIHGQWFREAPSGGDSAVVAITQPSGRRPRASSLRSRPAGRQPGSRAGSRPGRRAGSAGAA